MSTPTADNALDATLSRLRARHDVAGAERRIRARDAETVDLQVELSEIPAPPFDEAARGRRMAELFRDAGLHRVRTDDVGNVLGELDGAGPGLVVGAHLDTVFPPGTDVSVTRREDILYGPGISDDARGLAALVALVRALTEAGITTRVPTTFVATVGEEGAGDLRGVKHLFGAGGTAAGAAGFVSLDGAGLERIVVRGLGSRRFRISARGPGGHSWVDFGTPNPIHALGRLTARLAEVPVDGRPDASLTIARWGGGKSINAIPQEAWVEIDTRSSDERRLDDLESEIRRLAATEATDGGRSPLEVAVEAIGRRPAGETPSEDPLVRAVVTATRALGGRAELATSSTDANIPMAYGVPAVTIGCGGEAGKAHTTDEWYRNRRGADGVVRALYSVLLAAGVRD